jgi:hypothetical protein
VQRSAIDGRQDALEPGAMSQAAPAAGAPPAPADGPVRIDRSESGAAAAADLHANAFTSGSTIVLPSGHGPLDRGRGQSLLAHELVHVAQQRRLGAALPHESSPAGRDLEQEAHSAEQLVTTAATARRQTGGMPLARAATSQAPTASSLPVSTASDDVRSAIDGALTLVRPAGPGAANGPGSRSAGAGVLLSELDGGMPTASGPAPQRADDSASAPATSVAAPGIGGTRTDDPGELDELAHKLYERIRHRLSRELLLDRERAGLLTGSR